MRSEVRRFLATGVSWCKERASDDLSSLGVAAKFSGSLPVGGGKMFRPPRENFPPPVGSVAPLSYRDWPSD
jgi:hypothetical protein